jgi:CheY-like chemotaxis protein
MTKSILVADDSKTIRTAVDLVFRNTEFQVVGAASAEEAMLKLLDSQPSVVLTDLGLSGGDGGLALCRAIKDRAETASIPVLLLVSSTRTISAEAVKSSGADGSVEKPFDAQALFHEVHRLSERGHQPVPDYPVWSDVPSESAPTQVPHPREAPVFGAPQEDFRGRAPSVGVRAMAKANGPGLEGLLIEEPDLEVYSSGPYLEPPSPPSTQASAHKVDMWALADRSDGAKHRAVPGPLPTTQRFTPTFASETAPEYREARSTSAPAPAAYPAPAVQGIGNRVAERAAGPVADVAALQIPAGLTRAELVQTAREVIEQIAWEVVPELAETIIRQELARILNDASAA